MISNEEIKRDTDIFHIVLKFKDTFSGATDLKYTTVSGQMLKKMIKDIGVVINHFSVKDQIRYNWKLIDISRGVKEPLCNEVTIKLK